MNIPLQQLQFTGKNEGFRSKIYECSAGKKTIGYGLNLESGITEKEAAALLSMRMKALYGVIESRFTWFSSLPEEKKIAIADMNYQLGVNGFSKFVKSIGFMADGDYGNAADEFLDSRWAAQTPYRAKRVTDMIRA